MSKAAELANLIGNINAGGGGVNRNILINGNMNVKQRDAGGFTGVGGSALYHLDRWKFQCANTDGRFSSTQDSSVPTGKGFANSLKLDCTTADTSIASGEQFIFQQKIEGQNAQGFAKGTSEAKPFALSFYVKGNASATYVAALYDADNTRYVGKTFSVTTDWTKVEITFPADTTGALDDDNASSLELWIWLHAGGTYKGGTLPLTWASYSNSNAAEGADSFFDSTDRTFFITGLQLEVGQNPTEFEHEPFERSLEKCKRYYQRIQAVDSPYQRLATGQCTTTDDISFMLQLHPELRAAPDASSGFDHGTLSHLNVLNSSGGAVAIGALAFSDFYNGRNTVQITATDVSGDPLTAGDVSFLHANNNTSAYIAFDAEL